MGPERLGQRIARLRVERGWTQNDLASRTGISRVALSHIEAGMTVPGERTVALVAAWFGCEPHELVSGTDYPPAKAQRLPPVVPRRTELDHQLALCELELTWAARCGAVPEVVSRWEGRLRALERAGDPDAGPRVAAVRARMRALLDVALRSRASG